jgi:diguanylate cyclase
MTTPIMSDAEMRAAVKELEVASFNHEQWSEMIFGTLICRLPPDQRDMSDDAHHACRFGQWYYTSGIAGLAQHPGFAEIGIEHEHMHRSAATLLRGVVDGEPISIKDYDSFQTSLKSMRLELATLRRELEEALFNLDPLTGTPSRLSMLTNLREQRELVRRNVHPCTLAMMDLDHFKMVNDNHGHAVGDKVLISFAHHIMAHLRPYDKVFRYGGEEFLIFMPDADLQAGHVIIDRLRQELGALPIDANGKEIFHVTASFGLTRLDPDVPVEHSIDRADKALYVAKALGRNRAIIWNESMSL